MAFSGKFLFSLFILFSLAFLLFTFLFILPPAIRSIFAVLALFFDILAFSTKYYAYFFLPLFKMKNRTIVFSEDPPYRVSPNGDAIVSVSQGMFKASMFVKIPVYKSASEMSADERADLARAFSRAMTISTEPIRFSTLLYVINKDAYIDSIKLKLAEAEGKYAAFSSAGKTEGPEIERVKGEVTMWRNLFEVVSKVKSNGLVHYITVTGTGATEEEALAIASQKADEVAAGVSSIFGVNAYVMNAKEFLNFIEPDLILPFSAMSKQIEEKLTGE